MFSKQRPKTLWIVIALLGCGLALVALASQVVSARQVVYELKPPFQFAERPADPGAGTPPPGSTVLLTENFGASFDPITDTNGTSPQWRVLTNPADTAGYYWDRSEAVPGTPAAFANSAWSAAGLYTATQQLTPGVSTYPAGQDTWLIYGPVDFSKFVYGHLSFEYYLDSRVGDTLLWGYSTDGQTFYGNSQSGSLGKWITDALSFRADATFQAVYLAFAFNSHSNPQGRGAFVRNVRLTAEPVQYSYIPIVMNNYAPPTPTPIPPLYGYYFDESDPFGAGSDLSKFGGQFRGTGSGDYGSYAYGQTVRVGHGNPRNSLTLYTTASYITAGTSPNNHAPANFDLYVDTSPWRLYPSDLYGVIFGAGDGTFGSTPGAFNGGGNFYFLYYATSDFSVQPKGIRLDVCSGGNCNRLSGNAGNNGFVALPPSFIGNSSGWDTLHVQRDGAAIKVWVNNTLVISVNNSTYTGERKWGLGILAGANDPTYPPVGGQMAVDYDNIRLYSR
jgi:hypothetical protein